VRVVDKNERGSLTRLLPTRTGGGDPRIVPAAYARAIAAGTRARAGGPGRPTTPSKDWVSPESGGSG
jgi:hypothetical protein